MRFGGGCTISVAGLAKRVGARVLIASTSEVYGDPNEHPQAETYWGHVNPIGENSLLKEIYIFFSRIIVTKYWPTFYVCVYVYIYRSTSMLR